MAWGHGVLRRTGSVGRGSRRRTPSYQAAASILAASGLALYGGLTAAGGGPHVVHVLPAAAPMALGFAFGAGWGLAGGAMASVAVALRLGSELGSRWAGPEWWLPTLTAAVLLCALGAASGAVARLRDRRTLELLRLVRELRRARAVLAALYESGKLITSELEMERLIDRLLRLVSDMFGYPNPAILLLDEEEGALRLAGSYGYHVPEGLVIPVSQGLTGFVARTGRAVRVDDVTRDARYIAGVVGARSEMAVPIRMKDRVLGVLNVESLRPAAFTDEDLRVLQMVADQAAVAIQNARLMGLTSHLAATDGLTELYNHRHFIQQLQARLERARQTGLPLSLVLIDLDDFKAFNDRFGHLVGDEVLRAVGHLVRQSVRRTDMAARYGGEEFAILLPDTDIEAACAFAQRIRAALPSVHAFIQQLTEGGPPLSASFGVASYPVHARDWRELLQRADEACYQAKRQGKDRVVVWSPSWEGAPAA